MTKTSKKILSVIAILFAIDLFLLCIFIQKELRKEKIQKPKIEKAIEWNAGNTNAKKLIWLEGVYSDSL